MDIYINNLRNKLKNNYKNINFKFIKLKNKPKIESSFISSIILNKIKNFNKIIEIDLPKIEVKVLYQKKIPMISIQKIINRFYCILSFLDSNNINYNKSKFKLLFIPTNAKKILPKKGNILDYHHVNSGSSYIYKNDIMIWRQEECEKVFLHELFHCVGFDRFAIDNYNIPEFKIINSKNYNEGYNELCTCIYNCCFQSLEDNKDVLELFKMNKLHSLFQMKQVLQHNNFNSIFEIKYKIFPQNASVFSYYILKGMYLYNINKIINSTSNIYLYPLNNHKKQMIRINNYLLNDYKLNNIIEFVIKENKYKSNYTMTMTI